MSRFKSAPRLWPGTLLIALAVLAACAAGESVKPPPVCDLTGGGTRFVCEVAALEAPEDCRPEVVGDATRLRFLLQMTVVSLEILHLDHERGARGPFAYNDTAAVLTAVEVKQCRATRSDCTCAMAYARPRLGDLFYDAARCLKQSEFADDPLYFRGRGCR